MARTYKRDARGRFAGGGGGSGGSRAKPVTLTRRKPVSQGGGKSRGHLLKRQAVSSAKGKLAAKDPADRTIKEQLSRRSQKGAVTRAQRQLKAAQQSGSVRLKARVGVLRPGARKAAAAPDSRSPLSAGAKRGSKRIRINPKTVIAPQRGADKKMAALTTLKGAEAFATNKAGMRSVFLSEKVMTPARRKAIGLAWNKSNAETGRWRAYWAEHPSRRGVYGVIVSPRSGVRENSPIAVSRPGLIRRRRR